MLSNNVSRAVCILRFLRSMGKDVEFYPGYRIQCPGFAYMGMCVKKNPFSFERQVSSSAKVGFKLCGPYLVKGCLPGGELQRVPQKGCQQGKERVEQKKQLIMA